MVFFTRKSTALVAVSIAMSLSLLGCGEGKVSQCNKLIASSDKLAASNQKLLDATQALEKEGIPEELSAAKALIAKRATFFNSSSTETKTIKQETSGLSFSDEKLKEFHTRYVKILTEQEQATTDVGKILDKASKVETAEEISQLAPEGDSAEEKFKASNEAHQKLVDEINAYCGSSK